MPSQGKYRKKHTFFAGSFSLRKRFEIQIHHRYTQMGTDFSMFMVIFAAWFGFLVCLSRIGVYLCSSLVIFKTLS